MNPIPESMKIPVEEPIDAQEHPKDAIKPAPAEDPYDLDIRISVAPDSSHEVVATISCTCSNIGTCLPSCIGTCVATRCG